MNDSFRIQPATLLGPLLLAARAALVLLALLNIAGCAKRCPPQQERTAQTRRPAPRWTGQETPRNLPGSREPSGAVALPRLGGLLVVDDEPSDSPSWGIHFLSVTDTGLRERPVRFAAGQRLGWDDLEGVTLTREHVYLLGSHANHDADRSLLCRIPRSDLRLTATHLELGSLVLCLGGHAQRRAIEDAVTRAATEHGFTLQEGWTRRRAKKGGLNLEGIHFHRPRNLFYVGLRSPLAHAKGRDYAILLTMQVSTGVAEVAFAGLVDLDGRGIRALGAGPDDSILLSAGRVGKGGRFDVYHLRNLPRAPFRLAEPPRLIPRKTLRHHPWFKPEGLALYGEHLYLFSDDGDWPDAPAHYLRLPWRSR